MPAPIGSAGQWLTSEEIRETHNLSPACLSYWRRVGCSFLGGRKIRVKRARGKRGNVRYLHWAEDVRRAVEVPCWNGEHTDRTGLWLSTQLVLDRFGFSPARLHGWRDLCPQLGGRKLRAQLVPIVELAGNNRRCRSRWVWHVEDLEAIAGGLNASTDWLTWEQAREQFGWSQMTLWKWRKSDCPFLGGRRLRSERQHRLIRREGKRHAAHESLHPCRVYYRPDLVEIGRTYRKDPAATTATDWLTYREAEGQFGFKQGTLWSWANRGCPRLGGRKLRTSPGRCGAGNRSVVVTRYSRHDLEEIERSQRVRQGDPVSPAAQPPAAPRKKRGRPRGQTQEVKDRTRRLLEDWDRDLFGGNKTKASEAHGFDRADGTKIINEHERRKARKASGSAGGVWK